MTKTLDVPADEQRPDPPERPKQPTKAEMQWAMLRRMENAGAARSKVGITRNSKFDVQYAVEVAGEDVDVCMAKAVELEQALAALYPPPPTTMVQG